MKFSWLLALKIILILFWVVGIVFLWIAGVESKEGIIYDSIMECSKNLLGFIKRCEPK